MRWPTLWIAAVALVGSGCLDLSANGKVFACPGCVDGGRDAGRGGGDAGPSCNCPLPAPSCDGTTRVTPVGSSCLADGGCGYQVSTTVCPNGCADGGCVGDLCAGVACNQPPAPSCLDATTVETWGTSGTCDADSGACGYTSSTTACGAGQQCSQGSCVTPLPTCDSSNCTGCCDGTNCVALGSETNLRCGAGGAACNACGGSTQCQSGSCVDPCASVVCNQPPSPVCVDLQTVRTYASTGTCSGGSCSYSSTDTTCGSGEVCQAGACASGCVISGIFYASGAGNPSNACQVCTPASSTTAWSNLQDGTACGTGYSCSGGTCTCVPETDAQLCQALGVSCGSATGNDNCGASRTVNCGACPACGAPTTQAAATGGVYYGSTSGAGSAADIGCGASHAPTYFVWTPSVSGTATVSTCGSNFDTMLDVITGGCPNGSAVTCNDNTSVWCYQSTVDSLVTFNATAGTPYYFELGGAGAASGNYALKVVAPGGTCASPFELGSGSTTFSSAFNGSNQDSASCGGGGADRVHHWRASGNGTATITLQGDFWPATLYVRSSSCQGAELACNNQTAQWPTETVSFAVTAGTDYYIWVADGTYVGQAVMIYTLTITEQ